jgi:hypothetical protein
MLEDGYFFFMPQTGENGQDRVLKYDAGSQRTWERDGEKSSGLGFLSLDRVSGLSVSHQSSPKRVYFKKHQQVKPININALQVRLRDFLPISILQSNGQGTQVLKRFYNVTERTCSSPPAAD